MDRFKEICEIIHSKEKEINLLKEEAVNIARERLLEKTDIFKEVELNKFFESCRVQIDRGWTKLKNENILLKPETKMKSICISARSNMKYFWNYELQTLTTENGIPIQINVENFERININEVTTFVRKSVEGRSKLFEKEIIISKETAAKFVLVGIIRRIDVQYDDFKRFGIIVKFNREEFEELKKKTKLEHILYVYHNGKNHNGHRFPINETIEYLKSEFGYKDEDFDKEVTDTLRVQDAFRVLSE